MQLALGPCCLLFCVLEAWQILSGFIAVGLRFNGRRQGWGELVRSRFLNLFAGFAGVDESEPADDLFELSMAAF